MSNSSGRKMSYSQQKRAQMDYRAEYFAHNPGLFGCIWWCAYCKRPLVGKASVQVDHIMPLDNPRGKNKRYNLVASCPRCNNLKSNKVDQRVGQGRRAKVVEVVVFTAQKIVIVGVVAIWVALSFLFDTLIGLLRKPFEGSSFKVKLIALIAYAAVIYAIYKSVFA